MSASIAHSRARAGGVVLAFALAGGLACCDARAQQEDADRAQAAELFAKGVRLRDRGHCENHPVQDVDACREARENFRRAYALSPKSLGALRNLAYVEKGLGLLASATRHFRELTRKAPLDPQPERQLWAGFAAREADTLEPRVPHLEVRVSREHPPDLRVTLDGAPLAQAAWGTSLDVDPGDHVVRAEAQGVAPFIANVSLGEAVQRVVEVTLEPARAEAPRDPPAAAALIDLGSRNAAAPAAADDEGASDAGATQRRIALGIGAVGLGSMVVGSVVGVVVLSKKGDLQGRCGGAERFPSGCAAADASARQHIVDENDSMNRLATISTITLVAGGAVLALGTALFFTAPSGSGGAVRVAPTVATHGGGLSVATTWGGP